MKLFKIYFSERPFSFLVDDLYISNYVSKYGFNTGSTVVRFCRSYDSNFLPLWLTFGLLDKDELSGLTPYSFRSKTFGAALVRKIKKTGRNYLFTPLGLYTLFPDFGPGFVRKLPSSFSNFDWDFFSKSDLKELEEIGYVRTSL